MSLSGFFVPLADMEPIAANIRLKIPVGSRTGAGWKPEGAFFSAYQP
ncbi:hypothetical protein ACFL6S_32285 [Candidatus Poribacteria bacterium]